ncbi:DUF1570 domain-containing protein [bacterium]|nr:DUF1570 domain-containing protein [bacterium]
MRRILLSLAAAPLLALASFVALAQEKPPEQSKAADPAETDDDDGPNLQPSAGVTGERLKRFKDAVTAFKAAEGKLEKDGYTAAKKDLEESLRLWKSLRSEDTKEVLPLYYLGMLDQLVRNDRQARANLKLAVSMAPKFHEAWTELGDTHLHLGEHKDSDAAYTKALEIKPEHMGALKNRALERLEAGRFEDSKADVAKALEIIAKRKAAEKAGTTKATKASQDAAYLNAIQLKLKLAMEGPGWKLKFEKETENYVIRTNVDQVLADMFAAKAELIRKLYVAWFEQTFKSHPKLPKRKYPIIIFANAKEYHGFFPGMEMAGGHYDPTIRQLFFFKYVNPDDGWAVLYHEAFHQFLHPYLENPAPDWFNEGLGDYFGGARHVKVPEEHMKIAPFNWRLGLAKQLIASGKARPLKELLCLTHNQFYDPATMGPNYAEGWSFVYFLCQYENQKYFPIVSRYFQACRDGKDLEESYKIAFGKEDVDKIDKEWRAYITGLE